MTDIPEDDWREVVEDLCMQFAYRSVVNGRHCLTTGGLGALEGAFAALGWEEPHYPEEGGCQHPGCAQWASCGTPTSSGYKWLCSEHYRAVNAEAAS